QAFVEEPASRQYPGAQAFAFGISAWTAWMLGRPEIALDRIARAETTKGSEPYDWALARMVSAQLLIHLRDWEQADRLATSALGTAEENEFPQIIAYSRAILGHARSQLGHTHEGIQLIRRGISSLIELGSILAVETF